MAEEKKGFVGRLLDKLDGKLEKKSKEKGCCCCSSGEGKDKGCCG
jgi:hypothetical protein